MRIPMTVRTRLAAAFSALTILAVAGTVHAQFAAPTCTPPNCNPAVIQNVAITSAAQTASINVTGSQKLGGTFQTGALAPVLTLASDNLMYGNVGGTSTNGALLLLQFGAADRLRVTLTGQMQLPLGSLGAPSYSFIGDTNTGFYSPSADSISIVTGGIIRAQYTSAAYFLNTGVLNIPTGTSSAPSLTFSGDTNTGIFHPVADTVSIVTNGVTGLTVSATNNVVIPGALTVYGTFTSSGGIGGDGSALTNLNASNITTGTLNDARLSTNVATYTGGGTFTGANTFSNAANSFTGSGAGLTSLNATNITTGTLNDARLSSNVALYNANGTFTGNNSFTGMSSYGSAALPVIGAQNLIYGNVDTTSTGALLLLQNESVDRFRVSATGAVTATSFAGSGASLTSLNASNLSSGTVPSARISGTYSNNLTFSGQTSFGSAATVVAAGQNLVYGNMDTTSAGNLLLLQNESVDRFKVDAAGNVTMSGNLVIGGSMSADGSSLTNLNASNITSGTLNDARLSSNVALLNGTNNFTGLVTIGGQGICIQNGTNCPMSGTGTANYAAKWTGATSLGNSLLYDNGTKAMVTGPLVVYDSTANIGQVTAAALTVKTDPALPTAIYATGPVQAVLSNNSTAVYGNSIGGVGVYGYSSGASNGVQGALAAGSTGNGVAGFAGNGSGNGVYGITGGSGNGVYGRATSGGTGGYFWTDSTGMGVYTKGYNPGGYPMTATTGKALVADGDVLLNYQLYVTNMTTLGNTLTLANMAGFPTGTNGMMYYFTGTNKFRCYEGGAWKDCITPAGVGGSGSVNSIPKFTAATTLGNSLLTDNGATVANAGSSTVAGNESITGTLGVNGAVTLGDAWGDALTINAGNATLGGGSLNFDANTLFIDATNNRVGVGTNVPTNALEVTGTFRLNGSGTAATLITTAGGTGAYGYGGSVGIRGEGTSYGGLFESTTTGIGVRGNSTGSSGDGVWGTSTNGYGVYANSTNSYGSYNYSANTYGSYNRGYDTGGYFTNAWGVSVHIARYGGGMYSAGYDSGGHFYDLDSGSEGWVAEGGYAFRGIGVIYTTGDLNAPNNSWGTGSGWQYCEMDSATAGWKYCICPGGSFVGQIAFANPGGYGIAYEAATYCYKP